MNRGYIRVSTKWQEQGTSLADRRAALEAEGCQEIYEDVYNGASMNRPEFDRLCSEVGHLILHIMLAFSEFERSLIISGCRDGRAYKRATDPDYREGRKPIYTKAQRDHAIDLLRDHSDSDMERMTGISKATLTRESRRRGFRKSELNMMNQLII